MNTSRIQTLTFALSLCVACYVAPARAEQSHSGKGTTSRASGTVERPIAPQQEEQSKSWFVECENNAAFTEMLSKLDPDVEFAIAKMGGPNCRYCTLFDNDEKKIIKRFAGVVKMRVGKLNITNPGTSRVLPIPAFFVFQRVKQKNGTSKFELLNKTSEKGYGGVDSFFKKMMKIMKK